MRRLAEGSSGGRRVGRLVVLAMDEDAHVERARDPAQDLPHRPHRLAAVPPGGEMEEGVRVEQDLAHGLVVGRRAEAGEGGLVEDVADPSLLAAQELGPKGQSRAKEVGA